MAELEAREIKVNNASTFKAPGWMWKVSHNPDIPLVKICHMDKLKVNEAGMYIPPSVCTVISHGNR